MDESESGVSLGNLGVDVKSEMKIVLDSNAEILVVVDDRHYVCTQLILRQITVFISDTKYVAFPNGDVKLPRHTACHSAIKADTMS